MTTVIGFLTYQDFRDELEERAAHDRPVRIQDYYQSARNQLLITYTWYVVAACDLGDEVLVCRFKLGAAPYFEKDSMNDLQKRAKGLAAFLREDLRSGIGDWLQIRSGVIAASEESKTEAARLEAALIEAELADQEEGEGEDG